MLDKYRTSGLFNMGGWHIYVPIVLSHRFETTWQNVSNESRFVRRTRVDATFFNVLDVSICFFSKVIWRKKISVHYTNWDTLINSSGNKPQDILLILQKMIKKFNSKRIFWITAKLVYTSLASKNKKGFKDRGCNNGIHLSS